MTHETYAAIDAADVVYLVAADPLTFDWLKARHPDVRSLHHHYAVSKRRLETYGNMVDEILAAVRTGCRVCALFYGHPGVYVYPGHEAVRRAISEGYSARMLPGISAEATLYCDLAFDPASAGLQAFDATYFVENQLVFDRRVPLILWQVSVVGRRDMPAEEVDRTGLRRLRDELLRSYDDDHVVVLYEASQIAGLAPYIDRIPLRDLEKGRVGGVTTLLVPGTTG